MTKRSNRAAQQAPAQAAEPQAAEQAAWQFPKAAEIEAQQAQAAENDAPQQDAAMDAATAYFRSRMLIVVPQTNEAQADSSDEISDEELEAQQKAAEQEYERSIQAAMEAAENASPARGAKRPYIHQSSIAKPTKKVWAIADAMVAHAESNEQDRPTRAEIIAECIKRGIASGTSATQYQAWKKSKGY